MLIPYLGEKSKLAHFITPYIPKDISTYVEPFGGMAGVFFSLDFTKYKNVNFVYNDKNFLNYILFNNLRNNSSFIELVKSTTVDKERYDAALELIYKEEDEQLLALNWLIILTCSSPYEIGKDSWRNDVEFEIFKMKLKFRKNHFNRITSIQNFDYKDILKKYDSNSTFFFIDPPKETPIEEILEELKGSKSKFAVVFNGSPSFEISDKLNIIKNKTLMKSEFLIKNY